jgi:hypothetical protein
VCAGASRSVCWRPTVGKGQGIPRRQAPRARRWSRRTGGCSGGRRCRAGTGASVAQVREPRRGVSCSYRSHSVKREPELHTCLPEIPGLCWANVGLLASLIPPKNYGPNCDFFICGPGRDRTCDQGIMSPSGPVRRRLEVSRPVSDGPSEQVIYDSSETLGDCRRRVRKSNVG